MPPEKKPPPDCFTFMLAKAYQRSHGHIRRKLEPFALTNIQHVVLEGLWYQQGQTAAELGKLLVLDKPRDPSTEPLQAPPVSTARASSVDAARTTWRSASPMASSTKATHSPAARCSVRKSETV